MTDVTWGSYFNTANPGYGAAEFGNGERPKAPIDYLLKYIQRVADRYKNPDTEIDPLTGQAVVRPKSSPTTDEQNTTADSSLPPTAEEGSGDNNPSSTVHIKARDIVDRVLGSINASPPSVAEDTMANLNETDPAHRNINGLLPTTQPQPASSPGQQAADEATNQGLADAKAEKEAKDKALQDAVDAQVAREQQLQDWYGQTPENDRRYMNAPYLRTAQEREYATQLTQLKWMYDNAESIAKAKGLRPDQVQQQVSEQASLLREQAAAAGIQGLEGYGPGVTLHDAIRYLQSNDERARADGLNRYADSSADVYDDAYMKYRLQGENMRNAAALAERDARKYQKERLNFLRDMYHTYGLEGGYANDWATQILAQMAEENPALARYYTSMHGTPKELLGRAQQLQDEAQKHANEMAKKEYAAEQNALLEAIKAKNGLLKTDFEYGLRDRNNANSQFRQHGYNMKQEEYKNYLKNKQEIEQLNRRLAFIQVGVDKKWFTPDEAKALTANAYGFANIFGVGKGTSGDPTKSRREALNGYSNQLKTTSENLRKRLKEINAQIGWGTATPEQQAQIDDLSQQISAVDAQLAEVTKQYRDLIDQTAPPRFSMDNLEGSYANAQDFVAQAQKAGYSEAQIKEALIKELKANKFTDDVINKITNGLFPSEVSRAAQQGLAALNKR